MIFTGNTRETKYAQREYHEVVDLKKRLVLPAFTDGHCHFIKGAYVNSQLNLRNAQIKNDFINTIKEFKKQKGNKWIYGGYFSDSNFQEVINLNKAFLDEINADVPIIISKFDMHSAFANSKALELSGILNKADDFTSEEIVRDNNNIITGELKERAMYFVMDKIPVASLTERTEVVVKQMQNFIRLESLRYQTLLWERIWRFIKAH
ncbi:MAG: amidohydrolase family protein [Ignavibacteria bacterium]|nr:amidohydrolase family protein [Ignavibacteria bacterium]